MANLIPYAFPTQTLYIDDHLTSGYVDGDDAITMEFATDAAVARRTADGLGLLVATLNPPMSINLRFVSSSPTNSVLGAKFRGYNNILTLKPLRVRWKPLQVDPTKDGFVEGEFLISRTTWAAGTENGIVTWVLVGLGATESNFGGF